MRLFRKLFTEHPAAVNETYLQHLRNAAGFAFAMFAGGSCCLIHALVPGLFATRGSDTIGALHERMIVNRRMRFAPHALARNATPR